MRILIVEDEFISRTVLLEMLAAYGICRVAADGAEAVEAIRRSFESGEYFDLVCLDIMMPEIDGQEVLAEMRRMEEEFGIAEKRVSKVIMTTALDDSHNIMKAFVDGQCEAYLTKPIDKGKLLVHLKDLNLIR